MALTIETIKANEALASLSEEQLNALTTLSANDEAKTISEAVGKHHGLVEQDVFAISGIEKQQGEKSYEYMKRAMSHYKNSAEGAKVLKEQADAYAQEVASLKKAIAEGKGNEATAKELADAKAAEAALRKQLADGQNEWEQKYKGLQQEVTTTKLDVEFANASNGIKFKPEYPDAVVGTMTNAARAEILSAYTPDWVEHNGKNVFVLRDKDGQVLLNKKNLSNPYTLAEMLTEKLAPIIDAGKQATGAGSTGAGSGSGYAAADLGGARTQVEAGRAIESQLLAQGLTRGSKEFTEAKSKIWADADVASLPLR